MLITALRGLCGELVQEVIIFTWCYGCIGATKQAVLEQMCRAVCDDSYYPEIILEVCRAVCDDSYYPEIILDR
eukprot:4884368-Pleurochrysis_carterae.AAC.1